MIVGEIQSLLWGDGTIRNRFATYDFGDTVEKPAIFLTEIPDDCHNPCLQIMQSGGGRFTDRGHRGWEVDIDILLRGDKLYTDKGLHDLAWDIVLALDRQHLTIDGWDEMGIECQAPQYSFDSDGFPQYRIDVMVRAMRDE